MGYTEMGRCLDMQGALSPNALDALSSPHAQPGACAAWRMFTRSRRLATCRAPIHACSRPRCTPRTQPLSPAAWQALAGKARKLAKQSAELRADMDAFEERLAAAAAEARAPGRPSALSGAGSLKSREKILAELLASQVRVCLVRRPTRMLLPAAPHRHGCLSG
jgi:hypothetical protein